MIADYNSVLDAAQLLTPQDRLRLIDALWDSVPAECDVPLHEEWGPEIERRLAAIQAGTAKTIPWSEIREAALNRIGHGSNG
jgi:putative addiction module component (TIGR02574 family)